MIPFHCDALLPEAERYASLKFRRVHDGFWDAWDETELAAFLHIVPIRWAKYIFQWPRRIQRKAVGVIGNPEFGLANEAALDIETGLAVIQAMRDGGFRHGRLPRVAIDTLRELRHDGFSAVDLASRTGLSVDQVKYATIGRPNRAFRRNSAFAALAVG